MTKEEFIDFIEDSITRSKSTLIEKGEEYTLGGDRLGQFRIAGMIQGISPIEALVGMAVKHFISIADMAKSPNIFTLDEWYERTGDLRNYTILLEALLLDSNK